MKSDPAPDKIDDVKMTSTYTQYSVTYMVLPEFQVHCP